MQMHVIYKEKMEAQLKEWAAQINLLEAKLENAEAGIKLKRAEELHSLRAKQHAASEKMKELGTASGEAWEQLKITADQLWADLKSGVAEAHAKFK